MEAAVQTIGRVEMNPHFFRPGTTLPKHTVNFALTQGGLGDYICYLSVLEWIAQNHKNVDGRMYAIEWFHPIIENVMKKYPGWKVYPRESLNTKKLNRPTFVPVQLPINRTGCHAIDLGFIYYMSMTPAPADLFYSKLDLSAMDEAGKSKSPYAIMTPAASNGPKTMRAKAFNGIKNHLISKGITPIFIGKKNFTAERKITIDDEYDFSGGVDLTEKTELLQAAGLMSKAKLVIGLDNGLLHLAAMTEVPIIYGYTVSSVEHTMPRRRSRNIHNIHPDLETLSCTFCQSRMRMMGKHGFGNCLYGDNFCTDVLGSPEPWCELIDRVLTKDRVTQKDLERVDARA